MYGMYYAALLPFRQSQDRCLVVGPSAASSQIRPPQKEKGEISLTHFLLKRREKPSAVRPSLLVIASRAAQALNSQAA